MKVDDRLIDLWSFADDPPRVRIVQRIVAPMSWAIGFLSQGVWQPEWLRRTVRSRVRLASRIGRIVVQYEWHKLDGQTWQGPGQLAMGRDLRCLFQSFHFEVSLAGAQLITLERLAKGVLSLQFGQVLHAATYSTADGEITIATEAPRHRRVVSDDRRYSTNGIQHHL